MSVADGFAPERSEETAWLEQAAGVLRRGRPDITADGVLDALERRTVEGLRVPALGTPGSLAREPLSVHTGGWDIRSLVVVPARSRRDLLRDLVAQEWDGGATSLWLRWPGPGSQVDLAGLPLERGPIVVDCDDSFTAATSLAAAVAARGGRLAADSVCGVDPLAAAVRAGAGAVVPTAAAVGEVASEIALVADGLGVRAVAVDGSAAHDVGAGDAAELGWALAVTVEVLRHWEAAGRPPVRAFDLLDVRLAATVQQYPTVAKMRAARLLWARLAELAGLPGAGLRLHAVTSRAMLTRQDPETNQLRNTVAAFAAGVGGADAVTVLPYDAARGVPSRSPRRWARSVSLLLQAESHVARLADPAAGAFALEELTDRVAAAAWAEFQRIEAAGGAAAALADGSVRERWAATEAERRRRVAHRRQAVIGVTVHPPAIPDTDEVPTIVGAEGPVEGLGWRGTRSWAADVEVLQDRPTSAAVFVVPLGPVAAHQSAVGLAVDVLTAGGVRTVVAPSPPAGAAADDLVRDFANSGCPAACLAGPIDAPVALEVIEGLRAAGARRIIAAAGSAPGVDGVDDRIDRGDDVLDFLRRTRAQLESAGPAEGSRV